MSLAGMRFAAAQAPYGICLIFIMAALFRTYLILYINTRLLSTRCNSKLQLERQRLRAASAESNSSGCTATHTLTCSCFRAGLSCAEPAPTPPPPLLSPSPLRGEGGEGIVTESSRSSRAWRALREGAARLDSRMRRRRH